MYCETIFSRTSINASTLLYFAGLMGQAAYGEVDWVMSGVMVTRSVGQTVSQSDCQLLVDSQGQIPGWRQPCSF